MISDGWDNVGSGNGPAPSSCANRGVLRQEMTCPEATESGRDQAPTGRTRRRHWPRKCRRWARSCPGRRNKRNGSVTDHKWFRSQMVQAWRAPAWRHKTRVIQSELSASIRRVRRSSFGLVQVWRSSLDISEPYLNQCRGAESSAGHVQRREPHSPKRRPQLPWTDACFVAPSSTPSLNHL